MTRPWFPLVMSLGLVLSLIACGGTKSSSSGASGSGSPTLPTTGPAPSPSSAPLASPATVQVSAGNTAAGVDITVPAPTASTAPNAQVLGVAPLGSGGSAFNTGATIHRGDNSKVLLFGPGLDAGLEVVIGGPNDIAVSNFRAITSTTGTTGVAFDVAVSGNAAVGARTVFLRNPQNDMTAFTGGLEVVP